MVDLHTHLLFNTDDGVETMEEAIKQIQMAKQFGIDTICLTPHYIEPEYIKTKVQNKRKYYKLKRELKERKININLLLGNEIYISEEINENLKNDIICTIADTDYILIELPRNNEISNLQDVFETIINNNKKIIIAHPERYSYVQKNLNYFDKFIKQGNIYLQGNYSSIIGFYGEKVEKTIIRLIKEKKLHILATDIHKANFYEKLPEAIKKIKKISDEKYINFLIEEFPRKIINNENIIFRQNNTLKFKIFDFLKK